MSLLRGILRKNSESSGYEAPKALTSRRGMRDYAESIKSSSGSTIRSVQSISNSIASFYSTVTGGSRIPKRRKPDISKLGVPKFYRKHPKPPEDIPGVKYLNTPELGPYTAAHGKSFASFADQRAWATIVLYSHASVDDPQPVYHGRAKVQGELRIYIDTPVPIASIDVWLVGQSECMLDLAQLPFLNATANLWKREEGNPSLSRTPGTLPKTIFKEKFPPGTYVFPFEFPALPRDVAQIQTDHRMNQDKHCRVFLPPADRFAETSGWVGSNKYIVGVNIRKDGPSQINDEFTYPFDYYPRARPMLRPEAPFPFLPTRDDWPMHREEVGGWVLSPFGGRGRFRDTMVEVEGILGVQAPAVCYPGQTLKFGLFLWCTNPEALEALSRPGSVEVAIVRADMFGLDVLEPHNSSRKNRSTRRIGEPGCIWRTDDGSPVVDSKPSIHQTSRSEIGRDEVKQNFGKGKQILSAAGKSSAAAPKRMLELYSETTISSDIVTSKSTAVADATNEANNGASDSADGLASMSLHATHDSEFERGPGEETSHKDGEPPDPSDDATAMSTTLSASATPLTDSESIVADSITARVADSADVKMLQENAEFEQDSRAPSPTPSFEDDDDLDDEPSSTVRLDGEIVIPPCKPPSYRWKYQGIEYSLHLIISHPEYSHISPRATGIIAEAPVWMVTDPPRAVDEPERLFKSVDLAFLPKKGQSIPVGPDAVRKPLVVGNGTDERRPTWLGTRTWAFM